MKYSIKEVAQRLKGLREDLGFTVEQFAEKTGIEVEDYILIENGEKDFSITFLYKCSEIFDVELIEILTGTAPKLSSYCVVKKDEGLPIERRERFEYQHLAFLFKHRKIEPLIVKAPFNLNEQDKPIKMSTHEGQEFNYIIKGKLKFVIGDNTEILSEGDSVYYNSNTPHGMIAIDNHDCEFMSVLIKK